MSNDKESPAIACNLAADDYRERLSWIAELNATSLRSCRRDGRCIELTYDASALERVHEFVRRERQCCPFLDFGIEQGNDVVMLKIEAPEDVAQTADALFAPYTSRGHGA